MPGKQRRPRGHSGDEAQGEQPESVPRLHFGLCSQKLPTTTKQLTTTTLTRLLVGDTSFHLAPETLFLAELLEPIENSVNGLLACNDNLSQAQSPLADIFVSEQKIL